VCRDRKKEREKEREKEKERKFFAEKMRPPPIEIHT